MKQLQFFDDILLEQLTKRFSVHFLQKSCMQEYHFSSIGFVQNNLPADVMSPSAVEKANPSIKATKPMTLALILLATARDDFGSFA